MVFNAAPSTTQDIPIRFIFDTDFLRWRAIQRSGAVSHCLACCVAGILIIKPMDTDLYG